MPFPLLGHPGLVNGLIAEDVPEDNGVLINSAWAYPTMLDEMAYVDHTASDFMVLLSYNYAGRRPRAGCRPPACCWATAAVTSSAGRTWSRTTVTSPSGPRRASSRPGRVQSMRRPRRHAAACKGSGLVCKRGGHNNLRVAPGVYRREFARCYYRGATHSGAAP